MGFLFYRFLNSVGHGENKYGYITLPVYRAPLRIIFVSFFHCNNLLLLSVHKLNRSKPPYRPSFPATMVANPWCEIRVRPFYYCYTNENNRHINYSRRNEHYIAGKPPLSVQLITNK